VGAVCTAREAARRTARAKLRGPIVCGKRAPHTARRRLVDRSETRFSHTNDSRGQIAWTVPPAPRRTGRHEGPFSLRTRHARRAWLASARVGQSAIPTALGRPRVGWRRCSVGFRSVANDHEISRLPGERRRLPAVGRPPFNGNVSGRGSAIFAAPIPGDHDRQVSGFGRHRLKSAQGSATHN
jgi:hypothetical protein